MRIYLESYIPDSLFLMTIRQCVLPNKSRSGGRFAAAAPRALASILALCHSNSYSRDKVIDQARTL